MTERDFPPAFPSPVIADPETGQILGPMHPGMTLRDWFAGMALAGNCNDISFDRMADCAGEFYKIADAMLAAREGGGKARECTSMAEPDEPHTQSLIITGGAAWKDTPGNIATGPLVAGKQVLKPCRRRF